jgi:hypothetical protein
MFKRHEAQIYRFEKLQQIRNVIYYGNVCAFEVKRETKKKLTKN